MVKESRVAVRNYRIQRIYTPPPTVSRPFSAFYTYCQLNRNWTSLLLPFWEKDEETREEQIKNNLKLSLLVVVARAARPPAFLSTFFEPKNRKTEKQFFLIYVVDIFRGPDSIVISHGLFQSFSFSVEKCYGNVSTKHHTHRCELRRVISSFLLCQEEKRKKKMWRRRKQDPGWANFG